MALENVVEVHDGKVVGAYTAQAKNVSYKNGSVEDALDGLTSVEYTDTITGQRATITDSYIWEKDDVVFVSIYATTNQDVSNGQTILYGLPVPKYIVYLSNGTYSMALNTYGTLLCDGIDIPSGTRIHQTFSYIKKLS